MITKKIISEKLVGLRSNFWYSQEEVANCLWVWRVVYANIESGKRDVKVDELKILADFYHIQIDYFFSDSVEVKKFDTKIEDNDEVRISIPNVNEKKFREVFLYILEKLWSKPNFTETVLHKILYFSDFDFYELYENFFIWSKYIKNHNWPTSKELIKIITSMKKSWDIKQEDLEFKNWKTWRTYKALRKADLQLITWAEKEVLDKVIAKLWDMSATKISEYVHWDIPWIGTPDLKEISYDSVFYRTPQYSVRDYDDED